MVDDGGLHFGLLGPLAVSGPNGPITVQGPRQRSLLIRLLIEANQPVPVARLMDDLWNGAPPATAPNTLQTYVSRLRHSLGPDRIKSRHRGYRIEAGPDELDSVLFEQELRQGSERLAAGVPAAAAALLDRALARWRGDALADAAGALWAVAEVTRLGELQGQAWDQWSEAHLALGDHHEVVAAAEAAVARDPLRESMWRHLMLALYRSGRQADALRAFRRLGQALGELGLEPGRETRALEEAILLQKPELDVETVAAKRHLPHPQGRTASAPVPPAVGVARRGRFVGRTEESSRLERAWELAVKGQGRVVAVSGEAGIGKTRLVAEFAAQVSLDDGLVLWGRCDEQASAYQPFAEMLAAYLDSCPAETLAWVLGDDGPEVVRLVPSLLRRVPDLTPPALSDLEADRDRLLDALISLLRRASEQQPVLMVVDDLHSAPRDTLTLLRHLAQRLSSAAVLTMLTYRDTEISEGHPVHDLRAYLTIDDLLEPMQLVGLDTDAVTELAVAEGTVPAGADAPLADLWERTGGNPFFCLQLVRHLGEAAGGTGPPVGVRDVVRQRVDRLGQQARHPLQLAAVAGMAFDVGLLETLGIGPIDSDDLISILEAAVAARLLDEVRERPGQFRFVHALVQETLYAEVSAVRRANLHRRIAAVLAARAQPAAVVAHHMALGASAEVIPDVVMWSQRAAAEQVSLLAFDDALDTLRRAVALVDTWAPADHRARASLHLTLAFLLGVLGDAARQKEDAALAAENARAAGSLVMLVDAAIERATWSHGGVADPAAQHLLDAARTAATGTDAALLPTLLAVSAYFRRNTGSASTDVNPLAEEAEQLARDQGDPAQLYEVLYYRALLLQGEAGLEERRRVIAEMEEIEARLGPELWQAPTTHVARMKLLLGVPDFHLGWWDPTSWLRFRAVVVLQGGDMVSFVRDLEGATVSWGGRSRQMGATLAMWRGLKALLEGRFVEAEAHASALLELEGKDLNFVNSWGSMQFQLARERGESEGMRLLLQSLLAETPGMIEFEAGLAVLLADAGELESARSIVASLGPDLSVLQSAVAPSTVMALVAEVVGRLGDRPRARHLQGMLEPYRGQLIVVAWGCQVLGAADRYLAILADATGDWRQADELFEAALRLEESVGGDPLAARTRLCWARCLMARRYDRDREVVATGLRRVKKGSVRETMAAGPGRIAEDDDREKAAGLLRRAAQDAARLGMAGVLGEVSALQETLER